MLLCQKLCLFFSKLSSHLFRNTNPTVWKHEFISSWFDWDKKVFQTVSFRGSKRHQYTSYIMFGSVFPPVPKDQLPPCMGLLEVHNIPFPWFREPDCQLQFISTLFMTWWDIIRALPRRELFSSGGLVFLCPGLA